ncbi:WXG100 family type VII secretion target, partial [Actinopolyspora mortivallis]
MNNPLVEQEQQAQDGPGPLTEGTGEAGWGTGIGIVESVNDVSSLKDGSSWVESGLAYGGLAMEAASLAVDPIGTLMSYGLSWLIEHVQPLQEALDWFAGDPDGVRAYGQTWANVSEEVTAAARQYGQAVETDITRWIGDAGDAYRNHAAKRGEALSGAAELASTISSVVTIMGEVVSFVREFVRDLVADCVSRLITYALEAIGTLGLGTPVVATQATVFVSKTVTRIAEVVQKLVRTISNVSPKLAKMVEVFGEIMSSLGRFGKKVADGIGEIPDRFATSTWKKFDETFGTDVVGGHRSRFGDSAPGSGPDSPSSPDSRADPSSGPDAGSEPDVSPPGDTPGAPNSPSEATPPRT